MKVVLKLDNAEGYVRVLSQEPGDWESVDDINEATVFDLELDGTAFGNVKFSPPLPFDEDDYKERERMAQHKLVHVKLGRVTEDG